ncbi:MAG: hypothetical protein E7177_06585 [Erysipelotrichaceae bacterium]|nr:hypothetical protein [Erysipelotrichaceae bacterium]
MSILSKSNWFISWGWIILLIVGVLLVIAITIVLIKNKKVRKQIENDKKQNNIFLEIFGGNENIISCESKGSRLVLVLKDYSLLNEEKLKENGVTSLIRATNKVTLIIGEKSKDLEEFINENKRP